MSKDAGIQLVVKTMIKTLNQIGVVLTNIDVSEDIPAFFIEIDEERIIQSLEDTLKSAYGILWTLVNGKLTESNRSEKIDLKYVLKSEVKSS